MVGLLFKWPLKTGFTALYKRKVEEEILPTCLFSNLFSEIINISQLMSSCLTHLNRMEFPPLINWASPFTFKGCDRILDKF